ncbi:hypothetical protein [Viridibacillus arvi]|uniref:hypothetical protein n=1 Tax=Viridibacillus arvi TaxID=263475 RepID=UPI003D003D8E
MDFDKIILNVGSVVVILKGLSSIASEVVRTIKDIQDIKANKKKRQSPRKRNRR